MYQLFPQIIIQLSSQDCSVGSLFWHFIEWKLRLSYIFHQYQRILTIYLSLYRELWLICITSVSVFANIVHAKTNNKLRKFCLSCWFNSSDFQTCNHLLMSVLPNLEMHHQGCESVLYYFVLIYYRVFQPTDQFCVTLEFFSKAPII